MLFRHFTRATGSALVAASLACSSTGLPAQTGTPIPGAPPASPQAPRRAAETRDDWQRVADIFDALGARSGSRIADLGAGEGYLTTRLSRRVGSEGRVFAVDISETALTQLGEVIAGDSLRNVELILGEADDPRLPYGTLDGVVIVNAYHEMPQRGPILEGIKRALRPGGVVVIVDNTPADSVSLRHRQTATHTLGIDFGVDDLQAAGFEIVSRTPEFVVQQHEGHSHRQWMVVARRARK
jgi:SAM-dependent methyltransferase